MGWRIFGMFGLALLLCVGTLATEVAKVDTGYGVVGVGVGGMRPFSLSVEGNTALTPQKTVYVGGGLFFAAPSGWELLKSMYYDDDEWYSDYRYDGDEGFGGCGLYGVASLKLAERCYARGLVGFGWYGTGVYHYNHYTDDYDLDYLEARSSLLYGAGLLYLPTNGHTGIGADYDNVRGVSVSINSRF